MLYGVTTGGLILFLQWMQWIYGSVARMGIALLSDIHANLVALESVLEALPLYEVSLGCTEVGYTAYE